MGNKIVLHICCAPCACYTYSELKREGFSVKGFWYNPNIHGYREYRRRLMTLGYFSGKNSDLELCEEEYDCGGWFKNTGVFIRPERCRSCYRTRLRKTAEYARKEGVNAFTTTLLYSKMQDHASIKSIGEELAAEYGLDFLYRDFRKGWKEGIEMSKKMGLYRQEYCGCIFSERERYNVS